MSRGGAEREGDRIQSRLQAVSCQQTILELKLTTSTLNLWFRGTWLAQLEERATRSHSHEFEPHVGRQDYLNNFFRQPQSENSVASKLQQARMEHSLGNTVQKTQSKNKSKPYPEEQEEITQMCSNYKTADSDVD